MRRQSMMREVSKQGVNPFDDAGVAARYEEWYTGRGRRADDFEKRLLGGMLAGFADARTAIEIGCGTGHFTRWLATRKLAATGLDRSPTMLTEARKLNGITYLEGDALSLPFGDRSFDLAVLITSLEFVGDPHRATAEAVRVARQGLILGVINRWSLLGLKYRRSGKRLWTSARFFGPWELTRCVRKAAGGRFRGAWWRTTIWPLPWVTGLPLPWGGFIGLACRLAD